MMMLSHSERVSLMIFSWSIVCIFLSLNVLTVGSAWHGALWIEHVSMDVSWIRCFAVLMHAGVGPTCAQTRTVIVGTHTGWFLFFGMKISVSKSSVSLVSCSQFTWSRIAIYWSFLCEADCKQNSKSCTTAGSNGLQNAHHVYCIWWVQKVVELWQSADSLWWDLEHCLD